jgi:DNA-binding CsgD family transcriptional regulator
MVVRTADRTGLSVRELSEGLDCDESSLRSRAFGRLHWDDFAVLVDRLGARLGYDRFAAICAHIPDIAADDRPLLSRFVDAGLLYRFLIELMGPLMYPMIETSRFLLDDGTLLARQRLRPGFRESATFFRLSEPALASTSCFLGLPPSEVRAVTTSTGGDYWIRPVGGPTRGPGSPPSDALLDALSADKARLLAAYEELWRPRRTPLERRLDVAEQRWGLSPRQRSVLAGLARGLANKELAAELGCAVKTIETHVSEILVRSRQGSRLALVAAFWQELDPD